MAVSQASAPCSRTRYCQKSQLESKSELIANSSVARCAPSAVTSVGRELIQLTRRLNKGNRRLAFSIAVATRSLSVSWKHATRPHGMPMPRAAMAACIPDIGPKASMRSKGSSGTLIAFWPASICPKRSLRHHRFNRLAMPGLRAGAEIGPWCERVGIMSRSSQAEGCAMNG